MSIQEAPERPLIPFDTFGVRLQLARRHAGDVSIEVAAARCGLKPASWSTWERGVHNPPHKRAIAELIAQRLGVDPDWLFNGGPLTPEPPTQPPKPVTLSNQPRAKRPGKARTRRNSVYNSAGLAAVAA